MKKLVFAVVLVMCASLVAQADVLIREGGGGGALDTDWDDLEMSSYSGGYHTNNWRQSTGYTGGPWVDLYAAKDMLSLELPAVGDITLATLTLTTYGARQPGTLTLGRVTTDWTPNAAGSNSTSTSWYSPTTDRALVDCPVEFPWAVAGGFSASDYTVADTLTPPVDGAGDTAGETKLVFDITAEIIDMINGGDNYGFVLLSTSPETYRTYSSDTVAGEGYATAEDYLDHRPLITIVPEPATMSLLVLGGLGALIRRRR